MAVGILRDGLEACVTYSAPLDDQISLYTEMVTLLCQIRGKIIFNVGQSVREDMDVNEQERLSNITLRCILK